MLRSAWSSLVVLSFVAVSAGAGAEVPSIARYGLCASRVAAADVDRMVRGDGVFTIVVSLTEAGAGEFRSLSEANLGEPIEVVLDGLTLQRTQVYAPIASGKMLLGRWRSKEAATRIALMLVDRGLEVPCGPLD